MIYLARAANLLRERHAEERITRMAPRLLRASLAMIDSDCRERISRIVDAGYIDEFVDSYIAHHSRQTQIMADNKAYALQRLGPELRYVSNHRAGMNFVVEIGRFFGMDEEAVQHRLAHEYGVLCKRSAVFPPPNCGDGLDVS